MKMKKIVIACGTGIATSTVVADKIADICKQEGIKAEISQCKVTELKSYVHGADLIVSTTIIGNKYDVPIINGLSFITGIGEDETLKDSRRTKKVMNSDSLNVKSEDSLDFSNVILFSL